MLSEQLQVHVIVVRGKHDASLQSNVKGCSSNLSESANCTKHARAYIGICQEPMHIHVYAFALNAIRRTLN